jgi:hypothetical protein
VNTYTPEQAAVWTQLMAKAEGFKVEQRGRFWDIRLQGRELVSYLIGQRFYTEMTAWEEAISRGFIPNYQHDLNAQHRIAKILNADNIPLTSPAEESFAILGEMLEQQFYKR